MKSTHRLIIVSVILLVLIVLYGGLAWFVYTTHEQTIALEQQTALANQNLSQVVTLRNLATEVQPSTEKLSAFVIPKDGNISFIEFLETLGKEQHVTVSIVSVNEKQGTNFNQLDFQITAQGNWSSVVHYIELLEGMPYKTVIHSVALGIGGDTNSDVPVKGKVVPKGPTWKGELSLSVTKERQ